MKKIMSLSLTAVLVAAMTLTGACAGKSKDYTDTQAQGALTGAGGGAALGAIIGGIIGGRDGALKGAAIGAGAGLFAGLAYGTSVANKKAAYASEEEWLSACLAEVQNANQQTAAYNSRLKASLASYKKEAGSTGYSFDQSGKSDQNQTNQALKRDVKESGEMLALLDDRISSQERAIASTGSNAQTQKIQKEIDELKKQKQVLEQQNRELAALSNRIAM